MAEELISDHIKEQIEIIRRATIAASKSKETAIKFLTDAGILKEEKPTLRKKKA